MESILWALKGSRQVTSNDYWTKKRKSWLDIEFDIKKLLERDE